MVDSHDSARLGGVRWMLIGAIAIGVFVGAMSCAAGMATGNGHDAHVTAGEARAVAVGHVHGRQAVPAAHSDSTWTTRSDDGSRSVAFEQGHPGSACVTSAQLRMPDVAAVTDVRTMTVNPVVAPLEHATEPEPPVPRIS